MISFVARLTAALALAGAIISSPAYAADFGEARSVPVKISDLNLASAAGRTALTRRIGYAASLVCGRPDGRDLTASQLAATCRSDAIENAMPQVQLALDAAQAGRRFAAGGVSLTAKAL